ncbi:MAG: hypothetical protein VX733_09070 [Candidatus Latescibacterota bacterium]|nr:hypothetical protein [Candidatus Latescibacterota bacterium]
MHSIDRQGGARIESGRPFSCPLALRPALERPQQFSAGRAERAQSLGDDGSRFRQSHQQILALRGSDDSELHGFFLKDYSR